MLWLYFVIKTSTYLQYLTYFIHQPTCISAAKDSFLFQCYIILLIKIDTGQHVILMNTEFSTFIFYKIYTVSKKK